MRGCCLWSSAASDELLDISGVAVSDAYLSCSFSAGLPGDPQPWQAAEGGFLLCWGGLSPSLLGVGIEFIM